MGWFNRKKREDDQDARVHNTEDAVIEIVAHKQAKQHVVHEAKEASDKLNQLLVQNRFTLKIYLAAGGKQRPNIRGGKT